MSDDSIFSFFYSFLMCISARTMNNWWYPALPVKAPREPVPGWCFYPQTGKQHPGTSVIRNYCTSKGQTKPEKKKIKSLNGYIVHTYYIESECMFTTLRQLFVYPFYPFQTGHQHQNNFVKFTCPVIRFNARQ